jgi:hypothetical protein
MRLFRNLMSEELVVAIIPSLAGLLVPPVHGIRHPGWISPGIIFTVLAAIYIAGGLGAVDRWCRLADDRSDDERHRGGAGSGGGLDRTGTGRGSRTRSRDGGYCASARGSWFLIPRPVCGAGDDRNDGDLLPCGLKRVQRGAV